jgi:hypothetical protein
MPPESRPLPNRVRPDGRRVATPARGLFMGNRGGRFHDPASRRVTGREWATRQWICCRLEFRGQRRQVWGEGYTALFFCDEVTALAAGHRPCMECRRADALAFRNAVAKGLGLSAMPTCPELDRMLDPERREGREKRHHALPAQDLPDGAMFLAPDGACLALRGDSALEWSDHGYVAARPRPAGMVGVLTPPVALAALKAGYRPVWADSRLVP